MISRLAFGINKLQKIKKQIIVPSVTVLINIPIDKIEELFVACYYSTRSLLS